VQKQKDLLRNLHNQLYEEYFINIYEYYIKD